MNLGTAQIIQGNALNLPLPDASVDLICTSPPYFGLRSYQDDGQHYSGQIGSEATPAEFLDALLAATREMVRVLKPSGSIFVNLGDKYAGSGGAQRAASQNLANAPGYHENKRHGAPISPALAGVPTKSLMGIPWRYALRCIDDLGLILRAEIIWAKPNGLPESVTDRIRRSHEQWFHFTKQPRYYSAIDEIREDHAPSYIEWSRRYSGRYPITRGGDDGTKQHNIAATHSHQRDPLGKLPGSVWTIPTQPLTVPPELGVDHFAAYPMEWPRRIIQGWTPQGICTECDEGLRPVVNKTVTPTGQKKNPAGKPRDIARELSGEADNPKSGYGAENFTLGLVTATITGYICGCTRATEHQFAAFGPDQDARWTTGGGWRSMRHTRPAVVLDPFGGTGTTALVAKALGRIGITIDLSNDYCRLAQWRCNDLRELAAALQVEKPEPVHPDQLDLFSDLD